MASFCIDFIVLRSTKINNGDNMFFGICSIFQSLDISFPFTLASPPRHLRPESMRSNFPTLKRISCIRRSSSYRLSLRYLHLSPVPLISLKRAFGSQWQFSARDPLSLSTAFPSFLPSHSFSSPWEGNACFWKREILSDSRDAFFGDYGQDERARAIGYEIH